MRAFVLLAVISTALAAPRELQLQRTKKSPSYPSAPPSYGGCSGAAPLAPVALYLSSGPPQHYREDEAEHQHEAVMFEHHHHPEEARSYYEPAPAASIAGLSAALPAGPILAPAPAASAVFPGAKVGNCAVPLLLSCAPNVISGHLAHGGYAAPAYRAHELNGEAIEKAASEQNFQITGLLQPQAKSWEGEERGVKDLKSQAKWSGSQQAKSWAERADPLDVQVAGNQQINLEAPKPIEAHVESEFSL